jgi:hypothetical protein
MPDLDPQKRAKYAREELDSDTENEIDALTRLTDQKCSVTPRLISWMQEKQEETMCVPNGYIVYILMEKLPGNPPQKFWDEKCFSLKDRDEIRKSFKAALRYATTVS